MAGPLDDLLPGLPTSVPSFFFGNAPANAPLSLQSLQTRKAIVESMLKGRRAYPKTTGEGITAIGEALGERRALAQLDAAYAADDAATAKKMGGAPTNDFAPRSAAPPVAAPTADAGSPVAVPAMSYAPTDDTNVAAAPGQETAIPGVSMAANTIPLPPRPPVYDRSRLNAEVAANPALVPRLLSMVRGEVGGNPFKQQVQAESAFNRATARDQSLGQVLQTHLRPGDAGYYPPETFTRGQASPDILRAVMRGSDLGGQALGFSPTGNASGGFAADRVARGVYGAHRGLGSGNNMETYVTQERPDQLARLAASRVPASFPASAPGAQDAADTYAPAAPPPSVDAGPFVEGDTTAPAAVPGPDLAAPAPTASPYKGDRQSSATDGMGSSDDAMAFAPTDQSLALAAPTDQPAVPATNARDAITMALMAGQGGQRNLGAPRAVRDAAVAGGTTGDTARTAGVVPPFSGTDIAKLDAYGAAGGTPQDTAGPTDIAKLDAYGASGGTPQDTAGPGYVPPPPPTVVPDVVPAGAPKPVQVAANATANPPTITDIGVAPAAAPAAPATPAATTPPLISRDDFNIPPEKPLPKAPPPRLPGPREQYGMALMQEGYRTGDPRLVQGGQQMALEMKTIRDELYKQDMDKWGKDYADALDFNKSRQAQIYDMSTKAAALVTSRRGFATGDLPPVNTLYGPSTFGTPGQPPPTAQAPAQAPAQTTAAAPPAVQVAGPGVPATPATSSIADMAAYNAALHADQTGGPRAKPVPAGQSPSEWSKLQTPILTKQAEASQAALKPFEEGIRILNEVRDHEGRKAGVGFGSNVTRNIQGSPEYGFATKLGQLQGKDFLSGIGDLKATGMSARFTQLEAQKTQEAIAAIDPNQSPKDFDKGLANLEIHMRTTMEQIQREAGVPVTAWRMGKDNSTFAPDINQIGMRVFNGVKQPVQYIGGNPKLDSSYKLPGK